MKTLKWSSFALLFLCILSSCTKSTNNETDLTSATRAGGTGGTNNANNNDVSPGLVVTFNPSPATENQTVTVTGGFDGSTAIPDCGKLQLFQMVDGNWVNVEAVNLSSSTHEVSYQFQPTLVGEDVYQFKVHYISTGCTGFNQTFSGSFFLDVVAACRGLNITGTASAIPAEAGFYYFTVNYTVSTCGVDYTHLKTQGGLTAFSTDVKNATTGYTATEVGNSTHPNTIMMWEESNPLQGSSKTYSVTFKKAWSGSGPVQITGGWSVSADVNGAQSATANFDPIIYQ